MPCLPILFHHSSQPAPSFNSPATTFQTYLGGISTPAPSTAHTQLSAEQQQERHNATALALLAAAESSSHMLPAGPGQGFGGIQVEQPVAHMCFGGRLPQGTAAVAGPEGILASYPTPSPHNASPHVPWAGGGIGGIPTSAGAFVHSLSHHGHQPIGGAGPSFHHHHHHQQQQQQQQQRQQMAPGARPAIQGGLAAPAPTFARIDLHAHANLGVPVLASSRLVPEDAGALPSWPSGRQLGPRGSLGMQVERARSLSGAVVFPGAAGSCSNDSDSDGSHGGSPRASVTRGASWKNRPRNSVSRPQKRIFYSWLLDHTRLPFPTEEERTGVLAHDPMSERQFKYWFANIRSRQFTKHRDAEDALYFVPNAKFYESCIRLGVHIPHDIPPDIRRTMRLPRRGLARED
ncbi:hypothetical protein H4R18_002677 [Coemansia javaensis]|uniref:Homeobox domain-containing protein n=1 Tax=Coemansia javaensis TaxID=2761396 RepID=A0A9W8HG03_9FUNG|nr:hypothetical protein H4R18_002677 [Coemansia javaensis]